MTSDELKSHVFAKTIASAAAQMGEIGSVKDVGLALAIGGILLLLGEAEHDAEAVSGCEFIGELLRVNVAKCEEIRASFESIKETLQ